MALDPAALPPEALVFVGERHLATPTTLRPDGSPHSTPVGFTWDPISGLVRIISWASSRKVRNLAEGGRASVCQVDGGRWLTFEGPAQVTDDPARVAEAVRRYAQRYRQPGERDDRVAIEIAVDQVLGRA
jgi:F420H(2)-dependent biliverdin reductase